MKPYIKKVWVRRLLSLLVLTVLWEALAQFGTIDPFYAPAPSEILRVGHFLVYRGNDSRPFGSDLHCRLGRDL